MALDSFDIHHILHNCVLQEPEAGLRGARSYNTTQYTGESAFMYIFCNEEYSQ
jgi:hypothetical protein